MVDSFVKMHNMTVKEFEKACSDEELFKYCFDSELLVSVIELKPFIKNLKKLRKNPFVRELYGEDIQKVLDMRCKIAKHVSLYSEDLFQKNTLQFACWVFFNNKYNQTYAPLHLIKHFCSDQNIDLEDMFEVLIRHPVNKQLYTSRDLRNCELSIQRWLENACSLHTPYKYCDNLDKHQNKAVEHILSSACSVLQGNAGCGKTTTICEVIGQLRNANVNVIAAAFTHKAKYCIEKRIKDAGLETVLIGTVHAMIQFINGFGMDHIFLILDEASMLDIELLGELSVAMLSKNIKYQLCFVGDYYQLQPVGKGEIFRFLVESNYNIQTLKKCYRTDNIDLFSAFEMVRESKMPMSSEHFHIHIAENDAEISSFVGKFIFKHQDSAQIVCWQNKHIRMINNWVQSALFKSGKVGPEKFKNFYKFDKVVYTGDNTESLTNAMTGIVVDASHDSMIIEWSNEKRSIYKTMEDIQLSYCMSTHKSQGSEYKRVLVICYEVEKMNKCLDKRWLYTGITRGQHQVTLVSTKNIKEFIQKPLNKIPFQNIKLPLDQGL